MSRQKKQTVDYFPHQCNHSSTIFVLEQKYKNDGYSFWFKLLELLSKTEGHYYDYSNPAKWEFLQAKTGLTSDLCSEILNTLVNLEAIDKEAWENKGIWCQNFVDGIADVYRKRTVEIPLRPSFGQRKPRTTGIRTTETPKVNESKLNESKLNNTIVADKSDNKVNWDICNSNIQIIMKFWVSTYLPHLYSEYTNGEYTEFVSTHGKAIAGILKSCRNNASVACEVIKMAAKNFKDSGIENWSLYAVKRGAGDYFNEIKLKEKTKNGNN